MGDRTWLRLQFATQLDADAARKLSARLQVLPLDEGSWVNGKEWFEADVSEAGQDLRDTVCQHGLSFFAEWGPGEEIDAGCEYAVHVVDAQGCSTFRAELPCLMSGMPTVPTRLDDGGELRSDESRLRAFNAAQKRFEVLERRG